MRRVSEVKHLVTHTWDQAELATILKFALKHTFQDKQRAPGRTNGQLDTQDYTSLFELAGRRSRWFAKSRFPFRLDKSSRERAPNQ